MPQTTDQGRLAWGKGISRERRHLGHGLLVGQKLGSPRWSVRQLVLLLMPHSKWVMLSLL
jgi:hypothetical protein